MELSKTDNQSAFAQAINRRDGAMRDMLGMGSDPVGHAEIDEPPEPQVGIWRIAGNRDRSGWTDTVANSAQSREGRPMRRNPTSVSGVWLFLLSSLQLRSLGPLTERGIMNFKLTSWFLSFALAVLLFGIASIALFDRMHASL
jgi:hypothetical protein